MGAITKRRRAGLFTGAQPRFFGLFSFKDQRRCCLIDPMGAITKGLFVTVATTAPGIPFSSFKVYGNRGIFCIAHIQLFLDENTQ